MLTSYPPHGQGRPLSVVLTPPFVYHSRPLNFWLVCRIVLSLDVWCTFHGHSPGHCLRRQSPLLFLGLLSTRALNAAVRVVRYLKGTRTLPLVLGGDTVHLIGFADSAIPTTLTHVDLLVATASLSGLA